MQRTVKSMYLTCNAQGCGKLLVYVGPMDGEIAVSPAKDVTEASWVAGSSPLELKVKCPACDTEHGFRFSD